MTQLLGPCVWLIYQYGDTITNKKPKSCVVGSPGRVSCMKAQYTQGISLHVFSSDENDHKRRQE